MQQLQGLGIRDRKRLETRQRLERAAVSLVLRDGLTETTVDAISTVADVSRRTFFNYFDSKDAAVLGIRPTPLGEEELTDLADSLTGTEIVAGVVHLLLAVFGVTQPDAVLRDQRLEVLQRYPRLLADQLAKMTRITGAVNEAATGMLAASNRFSHLHPTDRRAQAEMLLGICGTAIRVTVEGTPTDGQVIPDDDLEARAISLVRLTLEHLA